MKVILSRKGMDNETGLMASPILPDGTLLSLPIPDMTTQQERHIRICLTEDRTLKRLSVSCGQNLILSGIKAVISILTYMMI